MVSSFQGTARTEKSDATSGGCPAHVCCHLADAATFDFDHLQQQRLIGGQHGEEPGKQCSAVRLGRGCFSCGGLWRIFWQVGKAPFWANTAVAQSVVAESAGNDLHPARQVSTAVLVKAAEEAEKDVLGQVLHLGAASEQP